MLYKNKLANLDIKFKTNNAKHKYLFGFKKLFMTQQKAHIMLND